MSTYKLLKSTYGIKGKSKIAESDNMDEISMIFTDVMNDVTTRALVLVDNLGKIVLYKNNESGKEEILPN